MRDDVEIEAGIRWACTAKVVGQFQDAEDTTEIPCVICQEEEFSGKCDNKVTALVDELSKELPKSIHGCMLRPKLCPQRL